MKRKVYDCFLFYNELDLLDLRLNLLKDVVDKFVILESTITFSGKFKPLFFQENKNMFENFSDKIIHVIVDDTPENFSNLNTLKNPTTKYDLAQNKIIEHVNRSTGWSRDERQWGREIYQRESLIKGLIDCQDTDIIIISDVDEIPNPISLNKVIDDFTINDVINFKQNMFYYYVDFLKEKGWNGPKIASYQTINNSSLNSIRANVLTNKTINDGGWHLSFMGGLERIKSKIEAYAHQEFNNDFIKMNIEKNIHQKNDLFFRGTKLTQIDISDEYPERLLSLIKEKYGYLISG